jgi:hypothetical protein
VEALKLFFVRTDAGESRFNHVFPKAIIEVPHRELVDCPSIRRHVFPGETRVVVKDCQYDRLEFTFRKLRPCLL